MCRGRSWPSCFCLRISTNENNYIYGDTHSVGVTFECKLKPESIPKLPENPDPHQIGVKWIPISELHSIQLYPEINKDIVDYFSGEHYRNYVEEHELSNSLC